MESKIQMKNLKIKMFGYLLRRECCRDAIQQTEKIENEAIISQMHYISNLKKSRTTVQS